MAFNPREPRDAHGRWVRGVGAVKKLVNALEKKGEITTKQRDDAIKHAERRAAKEPTIGAPIQATVTSAAHDQWLKAEPLLKKELDRLLKSGAIDKAQYAATLKAIERHTQLGRGIPHAPENHAQSLEYLARTLRYDSLQARHDKDITTSKFLSRTARAVEYAHAGHTGKPRVGSMAALEPEGGAKVTGGGAAKPKKTTTPKVVKKATKTVRVRRRAVSIDKLKGGDTVRLNGQERVIKSVTQKGDRYYVSTTDKQGGMLKTSVHEMNERIQRVTRATGATTGKPAAAKLHATEPKVVQKMRKVKIAAENLQVGDEIDLGTKKLYVGNGNGDIGWNKQYKRVRQVGVVKRIEGKTIILDAQKSQGLGDEGAAHSYYGKTSYGSKYSIQKVNDNEYMVSLGSKQVVTVKRMVDVKKASRKIELSEAPSLMQFHDALKDVLDRVDKEGLTKELEAELKSLDPAHRTLGRGQEAGLAQHMLYDMAWAKAHGLKKLKVKTHQQYVAELADERRKLVTDLDSNTGYRVTLSADYYDDTKWADAVDTPDSYYSEIEVPLVEGESESALNGRISNYLMASSRQYDVTQARHQWHKLHPKGTFAEWVEYARSNHILDNALIYGAPEKVRNVRENRANYITAKADKAMEKRIAELRKEEHTAPWDPNLPTWDEMELEPQGWDEVDKLMNQPRYYEEVKPLSEDAVFWAIHEVLKDKLTSNQIRDLARWRSPKEITKMRERLDTHPELTEADKKKVMAAVGKMHEENKPQRIDVPQDYVPTFYTASMLVDGVLYHRREASELDKDRLQYELKRALGNVSASVANVATWVANNAEENGFDRARQMVNDNNFGYNMANTKIELTPDQKKAVLGVLDKVERALKRRNIEATTGMVTQEASRHLTNVLEKAGASLVRNNRSPAGTGSWAQLHPGQMLLLEEGGTPLSDAEKVAKLEDDLPPSLTSLYGYGAGISDETKNAWTVASGKFAAAKTMDAKDKALKELEALQSKVLSEIDSYWASEKAYGYSEESKKKQAKTSKRKFNSTIGARIGTLRLNLDSAKQATSGADKRIEFVPWAQKSVSGGGGKAHVIPRNQRGRITLIGYSPEEAAAKLRELGIVGDLEEQIPATSIFGSQRRVGTVTPMLSDYVRGDAPLPTVHTLLSHGLTDRGGGSNISNFKAIAATGGLMGIAERHKRGIHTSTTSQIGDIASGVDHVVFMSIDSGGTCGSSSPVKVAVRPELYLRRDVLIADHDYGGGHDRYSQYNKYRQELEAVTGAEVGKTTLWTPLLPGARQEHMNRKETHPGSAEFNLAGQVSVEDMAVVAVADESGAKALREFFQQLLEEGAVTRIPRVILRSQWNEATKV